MKIFKKLALALGFLILAIMLSISSCKKNHCYHCYGFSGYITISKSGNSGTVLVFSRGGFQDSINHFISLGYTIDSAAGEYYPDPSPGAVVCDTNTVFNGLPVRDSCAIIL